MVKRSSQEYVPTANSSDNVTIKDVIGNKTDSGTSGDSIVSLTKKNNADILVVDALHDVPTQNLATNATVAQVVGNKTDTKAGSSLYAMHQDLLEKTTFPTQNLATNLTFSQVVGNKTDTSAGSSLYAMHQDLLAKTTFPTADLATNTTFAHVIGNKTDTVAGTSLYSVTTKIQAQLDVTKSAGVFTYMDAGGEIDIIEITPASGEIIDSIWLDLTTMTQNGTIKLYSKIDGATYRQVSVNGTTQSYAFTVADGIDGFMIPGPFAIASDFKVSYEEGADEGANRDIPYRVVRRQFVVA